MTFLVVVKRAPGWASYLIKTFGATLTDFHFSRLPKVISKAREAIPDYDIVGFLACALEKPPVMTGLLFCDHRNHFPEGLPVRTPPIEKRYWRDGYLVVRVQGGGLYVVAHWYFQNGALGPFYSVQ